MKKNANILEYVEKYKYKYGISYADEKSRLVKTFTVIASLVWVYSLFMLTVAILSFIINFNVDKLHYEELGNIFYTTVVCAVVMIAAAVLFFCGRKIAGSIAVIIPQPFIILTHEPIFRYGLGHKAQFYWSYAVPSVLIVLIALCLLIVLIRARVKTNKLYNTILDGLYKQYGTRDGEKLSEDEWEEFLQKYNPYKPII